MVGLGRAGCRGCKLNWMEPNCAKRLDFETNFIDTMLCKKFGKKFGGRSNPRRSLVEGLIRCELSFCTNLY